MRPAGRRAPASGGTGKRGVKMAGLVRVSLDAAVEARPFEGGTGQVEVVNSEV
jgi:hypothetical protein